MNKTVIRLNPIEKADLCRWSTIFSAFVIVLAASMTSVIGIPIPFSLRMTFIIVFGVVFNAGLWLLHRSASGRVPFTDDTRDRLTDWTNGGSARL